MPSSNLTAQVSANRFNSNRQPNATASSLSSDASMSSKGTPSSSMYVWRKWFMRALYGNYARLAMDFGSLRFLLL